MDQFLPNADPHFPQGRSTGGSAFKHKQECLTSFKEHDEMELIFSRQPTIIQRFPQEFDSVAAADSLLSTVAAPKSSEFARSDAEARLRISF